MGKFIDLTGQKFNRLLVIKKDEQKSKEKRRTHWICQCDCGNITSVNTTDLRSGHTKSCGCLNKEKCQMMGQKYGKENGQKMGKLYGAENGRKNLIDLTGQKFNRLLVLHRDTEKNQSVHWICQCDCGNIVSVNGGHLKSGHTKSCGCLLEDFMPTLVQYGIEYNTTKLEKGTIFGKLKIIELDKEKSGKGKGSFYLCQCECGNTISVKTNSLLSGHTKSCGCLKSKGELIIRTILNQLQIKNVQQKTFPNLIGDSAPLKFDFYLPEYNCCIEFQGQQHYKPIDIFGGEEKYYKQQEYDNKKHEYCLQNNVKLIEIPYWDLDKINEQYISNLLKSNSERDDSWN